MVTMLSDVQLQFGVLAYFAEATHMYATRTYF